MTIRITMCAFCRHFHSEDRTRNACDAFPEGIPREIVFGPRKHVLPVKGDHGIQFEPVDDCPQWIIELQQEALAAAEMPAWWRRFVSHVRPDRTLSHAPTSQEADGQ